jgi:hypothetical protein
LFDIEGNGLYKKDLTYDDLGLGNGEMILNNGELFIVAGYFHLGKDEPGEDRGLILLKFEKNGNLKSKNIVDYDEAFNEKGVIRGIKIRKINDSYLVYAESRKTLESGDGVIYYYYGPIIAIKLDKDFNEVWNTLIDKTQVELIHLKGQGSFVCLLNDNKINFFYNALGKKSNDNAGSLYGVFVDINDGSTVKKELNTKADKIPKLSHYAYKQNSSNGLIVTSFTEKKVRIGFLTIKE